MSAPVRGLLKLAVFLTAAAVIGVVVVTAIDALHHASMP